MTVYGWDVSNHDWDRAHLAGRSVDLVDARKAGISFVTHKVTEGCPAAGNAYVDPYFDDFARQLDRAGFPVAGSYHAAHRGHAVAEADFWFDTVNAKYPGWRTHPCWIWQIDAEPLDGYPAPTRADVIAMGRRIEERGNVSADRIVVYGPRWVYGDSLDGIPYRLWASNYVDKVRRFKRSYPGDRADHWAAYSGQTPMILQFSSRAVIGAQRTCDANAIRVRNEAALRALFLGSPTQPADLLEEIMALSGAPKTYDEFLDDVQARAQLAANSPLWVNGKTRHAPDTIIRKAIADHVDGELASIAAVTNATVKRIAALQDTVAKLPGGQLAVDVAAIASATADAVVGKAKDLVWGVK